VVSVSCLTSKNTFPVQNVDESIVALWNHPAMASSLHDFIKAWQLRASKWLVQSGVGLHYEVCPERTSKLLKFSSTKSASQAGAEQVLQELK